MGDTYEDVMALLKAEDPLVFVSGLCHVFAKALATESVAKQHGLKLRRERLQVDLPFNRALAARHVFWERAGWGLDVHGWRPTDKILHLGYVVDDCDFDDLFSADPTDTQEPKRNCYQMLLHPDLLQDGHAFARKLIETYPARYQLDWTPAAYPPP